MGKIVSIEVDLEAVFCDENGHPEESIEDAIRRQVLQEIANIAKRKVDPEIANAVNAAVNKVVDEAIAEKVPAMIDMLLNEEYTPTTSWGEKQEPTSVRKELLKRFREEFQYVKVDRYGNRTKNKFSEAVDSFVDEKLKEFKTEFNATVGKSFNEQAMKYVAEQVAKKFGA